MSLTNKQAWLRVIAWLWREFPVVGGVSVRSMILKELCGDACLHHHKKFLIRINRKKSLEVRVDTLLHEWAHCLTWFGAERNEDHGGEWGIAYAKIYSKFLEWNFGRKKRS